MNAGAAAWDCATRSRASPPTGTTPRRSTPRPTPSPSSPRPSAGPGDAKLTLVRSLYRRGYQRSDILELFRFIDWVLTLPAGLEERLWTEIQQFDEEKRMHYLASFEHTAQQKGIQQGVQQGISQGQARLLARQIEQRFGPLPERLAALVQSATPDQLETWGLRLLDAQSLEQVFGQAADH
jgi:hypothetical protein